MNTDDGITSKEVRYFVKASVAIGTRYLTCGGPTSRLESQIQAAGESLGLEVHVFATPTGLSVSCEDPNNDEIVSKLGRIKGTDINLSEMKYLDQLLTEISSGNSSMHQILTLLKTNQHSKFSYPPFVGVVAIFFIGAASSYMRYTEPVNALICGAITALATVITSPLFNNPNLNVIFSEFMACLLAFAFSFMTSSMTGSPAGVYAIGILILIVPGLRLASAVSEIAEQNYISGMVKLTQALFTFLAMGAAFLITSEVSRSLGLNPQPLSEALFGKVSSSLSVSIIGIVLLVLAFGVKFQVPIEALLPSVICGMSGFMVARQFDASTHLLTGTFLAAFCIGTLSLAFSRWHRVPSQVYSVPGILSLVPGMLALSYFGAMGLDNQTTNLINLSIQPAVITVSLVFGLITARIPFLVAFDRIFSHWHKSHF